MSSIRSPRSRQGAVALRSFLRVPGNFSRVPTVPRGRTINGRPLWAPKNVGTKACCRGHCTRD